MQGHKVLSKSHLSSEFTTCVCVFFWGGASVRIYLSSGHHLKEVQELALVHRAAAVLVREGEGRVEVRLSGVGRRAVAPRLQQLRHLSKAKTRNGEV